MIPSAVIGSLAHIPGSLSRFKYLPMLSPVVREASVVAPTVSNVKLDAVLKKFLRSIIFYFFIVHFLIANLPRLNKPACIRFTDIYTRILDSAIGPYVIHNLRFPLVNGDTHTDGSLPVFQQRLSLDVKQHTQCTTSFFNSHTSCIFSGTKLNRIVPNQTMQNIENQRKQN